MKLIQYPQEINGPEIEKIIIELEETAWPSETEIETFPSAPISHVTSFVLLESNKAICHIGIRKNKFFHMGYTYLAYGLSEVVTHPEYQCKGIGTEMLRTAMDFIISEKPDLSIFTCEPKRVHFYTIGGWQVSKNASDRRNSAKPIP